MNTSESSSTVLVVGGGIVGIGCAHYLTESGFKVTVIDQGAVGAACSHGNCGYICPSHVLPLTEPGAFKVAFRSLFQPDAPFRVKPRLSPALWAWMLQFAKRCTHRQMLEAGAHLKTILDASMREYRELVARDSLDCDWREDGLLYVLQTEKGMKEFAATNQILENHFNVEAQRLEGDELPSFDAALKPSLAGAFWYPADTHVRPDRLIRHWVGRLKQRGVVFRDATRLHRIVRSSGAIQSVETEDTSIQVDQYVFAMGAWSPLFASQLGCRIPIEPGKGYSVTMTRPDICPTHPMLFPEHKVGVTPFADGYRLGSMMEFAGYDTTIPSKRIEQLRRSAEPYLVEPHVPDNEETWYGWRPMTYDSLPIIGRVPKLDNALLATGHNMLGLTLAAATGRLIAEMAKGDATHIDASPYSPARF